MTRIKQLRARLILWLVGLLIVVLGAVFVAVYSATNLFAERQAQSQLELGAKVFSRILEMQAEKLASATDILVADYGFREAVASGDLPTIRSALMNQANRIGADEALFLDSNGAIQVSGSTAEGADQLQLAAVQELNSNALIVIIGSKAYLLVEALVMAPVVIGQVAMAFHLDAALAEEMKRLSGLEVSFITLQDDQRLDWASTLETADDMPDIGSGAPSGMPASDRGMAKKEMAEGEFLSTQIVLLDQDSYRIKAELLSPLGEALAAFDELKRELLVITLIALGLSSMVAYVMAGSLASPVRLLAEAARRIGQGDYATSVSLARDDELGRLASSIDTMRLDIAERERQLAHNAYHEPLTGLGNLAKTRERLVDALVAKQPGVLVVLLMSGVEDLLKARGQSFHDQLICLAAERLNSCMPANSLLSYCPGQGFYLVLNAHDIDQAVIATDLMIGHLSQPLRVDGLKISVAWLAGVVEWPRHSQDADELLRQVSIAATDAKPGPERIAVYEARRDQDYMRRMRLIRDIHFAPQMKELSVVYQPKLDLATGRVTQVEALMRWQHSELGPIAPDEFIQLAEQTGSIHKLTLWMLAAIASQLRTWIDRGLHLQVAMNISALDLDDERFPERITMILQPQELTPDYLTLEVTESALMRDPAKSLSSLLRLRESGLSLAVDDYGTGYSSLATLKSLPVQDLKIDKSFVLHLAEGSDDAVIVKSTIELAHNMGLRVIAEGVETEVSLDWLRSLGCDTAQGYFISRPLAASVLENWLKDKATMFRREEA